MGIEIPDELQWVAKWILGAGDWPEGDETAMRRVADAWTTMAQTLNTVDDNAAVALNVALTALSEGETHTTVAAFRDKLLNGDEATFTAVRKWCETQAELLNDGANDIEHTKLVIIGTMIITAAELVVAGFTAWTGIGAVAGAAARVAGQIAVRVAIRQLIARMLTRGAAKAAARLALRGAAFEALEEGGTDLSARLIQLSNGDRSLSKFGLTDLGLATFGGAVGGAVGGLLGGGTGALGDLASSTTGKLAGKVVGGTVTELGADVSAQVAAAGVGAALLGQEFKLDIGLETFTSAGAGGVQSTLESGGHGGPATAPTVPELDTDAPDTTLPAGTDDQAPSDRGATTPAGTDTEPGDTTPAGTDTEPATTTSAGTDDGGANTPPTDGDTDGATDPASTGDPDSPTDDATAPQNNAPDTELSPSNPNDGAPSPDDSAPSTPDDSVPSTPDGSVPSIRDDNGPVQVPAAVETTTDGHDNADVPTIPSPGDTAPSITPTGSTTDLPPQSLPTDPTDTDPANNPPVQQVPTTLTPNDVTQPGPTTPANPPTTQPTSTDTSTAATTTTPAPQTGTPTPTTTVASPTTTPSSTPTTPTPPVAQAPNSLTPTPSPRPTTTPTTPPRPAPTRPNTNAPSSDGTQPTSADSPATANPASTAPTSPTSSPRATGTTAPTTQQAPSTQAQLQELGTSPTPPPAQNTHPFGPNPTPTPNPTTQATPNPQPHNQARSLRETLRNLPSQDGHTVAVDANRSPFLQRPPAYRIRRFHLGGNQWVAVATIRAYLPNAHSMSPAELSQAMESIQATVDATFNNGSRLLGSKDQLLVDVEFTTDPTSADTALEPHQPPNTTANALREHMGLFPAQPGSPLSPDDLREISNDIARANTPARFSDPANTRVVDHRRLDDVEDPGFQTAVEDSLRAGNSFVRGADPRTHPYGQSVNDGGRTVPGRGNNCVDCSIAALSSFFGIPRVSAPRWPDLRENGQRDNTSGEWGGRERAGAWLGANWGSYSGMSLPDQYQALHNYIASLGPGSAAMVGQMWHARDANGNKLYNADGSPVYRGGHATVVVFPPGAAGPVWWDPQSGETFDAPPASLTENAASMECIPIDANGGPASGGTSIHPGTGQTFAGPSVRTEPGVQHPGEPARLGVPADGVPDGTSPVGNGLGQLRNQQTYGSDHGALEHGYAGDRGGIRRDDGSPPAPAGLPGLPGTTPDPAHQDLRGPEHDRVSDTPDLSGQTERPGDHPGSRDHQESDPAPSDGPHLGGRDIMGVDAEPEHGNLARGGDDRGVVPTPVGSPETAPQQVSSQSVPIAGDPNNVGTAAHPTDVSAMPPTPASVTPSPQQVHNANQSRAAREGLRNQQPDGGVQPVTDRNGGRRFTWGRYTSALGVPVSVLRISVAITGAGSLDPATVAALLERAQLAVDLRFNGGLRLLSDDWMMVDLVPVGGPADMTIDLDPASHGSVDPTADVDALTALLRQQLGLPDTEGTDLTPNDVRELSNSIARANTPAPFDGLGDTRVEGEHLLDSIEQDEYQHDVEDALRDGNRFLVGADPRTNDYGRLINDGGPSQQGRSNNCLDGSLAALSSFFGRPEVGAPRWPDIGNDGSPDTDSGEIGGPDRAAAWLGGSWQFGGTDQPIAQQFQALHDQIRSMGPGSAALVINSWHAFDQNTGQFEYNADGTPTVEGAHATVVVFPHGATGPVWWDPQHSTFSDTPPLDLTGQSVGLWSIPLDPQGATYAGTTAAHQGTSAGIPGGGVPDPDLRGDRVPARVGVPTGADAGTDRDGPSRRPDQLRAEQANRDGDGPRQPASDDDREELRPSDRNRPTDPGQADLPEAPPGDIPPHGRDLHDNHLPSDSGIAGEPHPATPDLPADVRQADPETDSARTDGLPGDLEGQVAQPSGPELADGRDDRGLDESTDREPAGGAPERDDRHLHNADRDTSTVDQQLTGPTPADRTAGQPESVTDGSQRAFAVSDSGSPLPEHRAHDRGIRDQQYTEPTGEEWHAVREAAREAADNGKRPPKIGDPKMAAALQMPDGRMFSGYSMQEFDISAYPDLQDLVNSIPANHQSIFKWHCAELDCITQALRAGYTLSDLTGARSSAAMIRGTQSAQHGKWVEACRGDKYLLGLLGIEW